MGYGTRLERLIWPLQRGAEPDFRFILVSEKKLAKLQPLPEIIFQAGNGIIH
jgi:hypothetical protein